jgi:hypothetical protein
MQKIKRNIFYFLTFIFSIIIVVACMPSSNSMQHTKTTTKINGLSFVASPNIPDTQNFAQIKNVHANWVSLMPFAFMTTLDTPIISYNQQRQWKGETIAGIKETTLLFKNQHINVMIKPQIWIGRGAFTGHIKMKNDADWVSFGEAYKKYILAYAEAAQQVNAAMFCIGTELNSFVLQMPKYWDTLINDVKKVYKGKITYAENWDTYTKVPFWKQLDFIGVDAYFPITVENDFMVQTAIEGWEKHKQQLQFLAKESNKNILFTEYGYRSVDYNLKEPWASNKDAKQNNANQTNALEALYSAIWDEPWMAGGFLWKWYDENDKHYTHETDYTPQGKPALEIVKKWYSKN